jgi:hypothetical protein
VTPEQFFEKARDPYEPTKLVDLHIWRSSKNGMWRTSSCGYGGEGQTVALAIEAVFDHMERVRIRNEERKR